MFIEVKTCGCLFQFTEENGHFFYLQPTDFGLKTTRIDISPNPEHFFTFLKCLERKLTYLHYRKHQLYIQAKEICKDFVGDFWHDMAREADDISSAIYRPDFFAEIIAETERELLGQSTGDTGQANELAHPTQKARL